MTIVEALKRSQETGESFSRMAAAGPAYSGWIRYDAEHLYHGLSAGDLLADDWEPSGKMVEKLTDEKWVAL